MQELMVQGITEKLQKSRFRYKKNSRYIESNHIL